MHDIVTKKMQKAQLKRDDEKEVKSASGFRDFPIFLKSGQECPP